MNKKLIDQLNFNREAWKAETLKWLSKEREEAKAKAVSIEQLIAKLS